MNYCHLTKKLRSGNTILNGHYMNNLYGDACRSVSSFQLSSFELVLKKLENRDIFWMREFYTLVKKLDETLLCWSSAHEEALQAMQDFFLGVSEIEDRQKELDEEGNELEERGNELEERGNELEEIKKEIEFYKTFILEYSIQVLRRFLDSNLLLPLKASQKLLTNKNLELFRIALRILENFFHRFEYLAEKYAEDQIFINSLFAYMKFEEIWSQAYELIKNLILTRKNPLDLSAVANIQEIVMELNYVQFGGFCEILAITLSKLDMYENKISLYAKIKEKKNQNFVARNINHDIILKIPKIISRLIDIAFATPCVNSLPNDSPNAVAQLVHWILDEFNAEKQNDSSSIQCHLEWLEFPAISSPTLYIQKQFGLTFRPDALRVLDHLLVGRYRKEVQEELVKLQLIPRLSNLFDQFTWQDDLNDCGNLSIENNPFHKGSINKLKIQMLKIIHNFCDDSEYRLVMLSPNEYSELQHLRNNLNITNDSPWLTHNIMCVGNEGLLSKLVEIIKNEIYNVEIKFWLTQAIVSFLRSSSAADQEFLLRRNLLKDIVQNLVFNEPRNKKVLQGSFNLLGELVKFNPTALKKLNSIIGNSRIKKKFTALMDNHIVDSNIFLRYIILSYEFFCTSIDKNTIHSTKSRNTFLFEYSNHPVRRFYLLKVLSVININKLTHEYVCCINTMLIILIFALRKGEISRYLQFLATCLNASMLRNLKTLLLLWEDHYLQKNFTVLEKTSRICFQEWKSVVSLLTSDDCKNPCTIAFYTVHSSSP